jgi:hypothetical protein
MHNSEEISFNPDWEPAYPGRFKKAVNNRAKDDLATGGKILTLNPSLRLRGLAVGLVLLILGPLLIYFTFSHDASFRTEATLILTAFTLLLILSSEYSSSSRILLTQSGISESHGPVKGKFLLWSDIVAVTYQYDRLIFTSSGRRKIAVYFYSNGLKDLGDYMRRYLRFEVYAGVQFFVNRVRYLSNPVEFEAEEAARAPAVIETQKQAVKASILGNLDRIDSFLRWFLTVVLIASVVTWGLELFSNLNVFLLAVFSATGAAGALMFSFLRPVPSRMKDRRSRVFALISLAFLIANIFAIRLTLLRL